MKIYLHIVNNRPFCYSFGKDSETTEDLQSFITQTEGITGTKFAQRPDRCVDNIDFYAADGRSQIHVLEVTPETIEKNA
jgi:hypothetical protein